MGMEEPKTYIVAVDDLFRVEANSEPEAEEILEERVGEDPFQVRNARVIEVEE